MYSCCALHRALGGEQESISSRSFLEEFTEGLPALFSIVCRTHTFTAVTEVGGETHKEKGSVLSVHGTEGRAGLT